MQLYGRVARAIFYTQFGLNNFTYNSKQFSGGIFSWCGNEFTVHEKWLSIGAGLTGWSGLSRLRITIRGFNFIARCAALSASTNGVNDQFLRKLSVYAKGKIGKLDYRFALSKPMAIQNAVASVGALSSVSDFALTPPKLQTQGYVMYQFLDQEDNTIPILSEHILGKNGCLI